MPVLSAADLIAEVRARLPDNNNEQITALDVRTVFEDLINSVELIIGVQLPSDVAAAELNAEIEALLPDNTSGSITPASLRTVLHDIISRLNGALTTIPPVFLFGTVPRGVGLIGALTTGGAGSVALVGNIPGSGTLAGGFAFAGNIPGTGTLTGNLTSGAPSTAGEAIGLLLTLTKAA